jgi:tetratricopeptide (TPR) repeat protein
MEDPEWLAPAGLQLALAALGQNDFNEVVAVTGRILEQDPDHVQALLLRAQARAHWKKDPELALADANRVLELDPEMIEAFEPRILALLNLGELEQASEALAEAGRRLVERDAAEPVLAWHCSTTASFEEQSGEVEQARQTWIRCLEAHPTDPEVVSSALAFYEQQGEPERAIEVVRTAVAGAPDSRVFRVALAQRLRLAGQAAEAEAVLRETTHSDDPLAAAAAWLDLGNLRRAFKEYGAAADALGRAVDLMRGTGSVEPRLLFEYADALVLAGRLDRAVEVAQELTVPAHRRLILGRVKQERRDPAGALAEYEEALRLWPDNPWARYYAALAAVELGDFPRALEEYRSSIRISPDATDARTRAAALLFAEGRAKLAYQTLLHVRESTVFANLNGQLLLMRLLGFMRQMATMRETLAELETSRPAWVGRALAAAAEGAALQAGPAVAQGLLGSAPVDLGAPRYAAALRALVRFAHEAGDPAAAQAALQEIFAARPDSGALQAIVGLDLELSGAPAVAVRAAYTRALELEPENPGALAGLGRLALGQDPEAALAWFDRAAVADPSDPDPKLQTARALIAAGRPAEAGERLDALLLAHPFEAEAAAERVRLDLEQGVATERTLERARRAVRFGRSADALELLGQVYALRGETELAEQSAERARVLREAKASARDAQASASEGEASGSEAQAPASEAEVSESE